MRESILIDKSTAEKFWDLFADEYSIGEVTDGMSDEHGKLMNSLKQAIIRFAMSGWVEILEDPDEGVIIKQHLKLPLAGVEDNCLIYKAQLQVK